jgi:lipid II:glycine glycyltransferase (peptidoglycan interpeptide bridge formation enzyme)
MAIHVLDPLTDSRWDEFVDRHPHGSVFHSSAWLTALRQTYGYPALALTTAAPSMDLSDGLVLCRVCSRWTGRRLVSVPFADHCDPLLSQATDGDELFSATDALRRDERFEYVELRPLRAKSLRLAKLCPSDSYVFHSLDLEPDLDDLFARLHPAGMQRKIRRARREGIHQEEGRSERVLRVFHHLLTLTRRRHGMPPQPLDWFRHLAEYLGDRLTIRIALKGEQAIAAILLLRWKDVLIYKYGASDARYHSMGAMPYLLWEAMREARARGLRTVDLGRSDADNTGLVRFKDHLGATRSTLNYFQFPRRRRSGVARGGIARTARRVFPLLPERAAVTLGRLLYRHFG